jgi:hypothetical protein
MRILQVWRSERDLHSMICARASHMQKQKQVNGGPQRTGKAARESESQAQSSPTTALGRANAAGDRMAR